MLLQVLKLSNWHLFEFQTSQIFEILHVSSQTFENFVFSKFCNILNFRIFHGFEIWIHFFSHYKTLFLLSLPFFVSPVSGPVRQVAQNLTQLHTRACERLAKSLLLVRDWSKWLKEAEEKCTRRSSDCQLAAKEEDHGRLLHYTYSQELFDKYLEAVTQNSCEPKSTSEALHSSPESQSKKKGFIPEPHKVPKTVLPQTIFYPSRRE